MKEDEINTIKILNKIVKDLINGKTSPTEFKDIPKDVSGELEYLVENMEILVEKHNESKDFIMSIANGDFNSIPPKGNQLIAPLKQLHADLLHLTWQTKAIALGDYNQKVSFMGDFSTAFNSMIESLKEKKKLEEKLIESNASKDKFFSLIAHDLKSPFNSLLGFLEILDDDYENLSEANRKEFINYVFKDAKQIFNLIQNLLTWSKTQTNRISFNPDNYALESIIDNNISLLKSAAATKGISIIKNILEKVNINVDKEMINTVFRNLLSNAIKFTKNGGEIVVGTKGLHNNKLKLFVSDIGVGINKKDISKLFKLGTTHTTLGTENENGSGLGLLICKEFVEQHNGEIWVESEQGKGSVFYFTIPVATGNVKAIPVVKRIKSTTETLSKKLKILIAEDEEISDNFFSIILKEISSQLMHAKTGKEAVEICRQHPDIDLILMDIKMPIMSGYDATKQIRKFNKDIIIIAQTAYALAGDREKAIDTGCNDYITKPIDKDELMEMIERLVSG